ncbi:MAG: hypothetical protein ACKE5M_06295 [Methylophilaceae bacterium]
MINNNLLPTLHWHLYRIAEKLGNLGKIAIVLLVAAAIAYVVLLRPLSSSVDEARFLLTEQPEQELKQAMSDEERLSAFQKALPSINMRASAIQSFMDIAMSEGLQPNEVAYKEARLGVALSQYHVEFSLYAPYPEIQHFLSVLLHQLNYVSIESLTLNRESVKGEDVEAHIHLVFHFNRLPAQPSGQAL